MVWKELDLVASFKLGADGDNQRFWKQRKEVEGRQDVSNEMYRRRWILM